VSDELVSITAADEHSGVLVHDRVDDARFKIRTDCCVEPRRSSTDNFRFPVDEAVSIGAEKLVAPQAVTAYARSLDDGTETQLWKSDGGRLETGQYEIQVMGVTPMVYLRVSGPLTVPEDRDEMRFQFEERQEVEIGARTCHEQPAGTIQTTEDPHDVARAVSTFGSALKTLSPERSFPSLRGHPPLLETGPELSIPDNVSTPESDIVVEVPADLGSIYRVAPLAYYLGATVECGAEPRLVAGDKSLPLSTDGLSIGRRIDQLLQQSLFLDCVVRTEGLYRLDLEERMDVEEMLPFDLETMYDVPLSERVVAYDDVSYHVIKPHMPRWPLRTTITPDADYVGYLPFVAYWLSSVRLTRGSDQSSLPPPPAGLADFTRDTRGRGTSGERRSLEGPDAGSAGSETLARTWIGDGIQSRAMKPHLDAMQEVANHDTKTKDKISVVVVCTDREMLNETRNGIYDLRNNLEFDVSVHYDASIGELRSVLHQDYDFFHYVGHVDEDGFRCTDGHLDANDLDSTEVDAFLVNACRSYDQGEALVDVGAKGGIVTVQKVFNHRATTFGREAGRFLNRGYSLDSTLSLLDYGPLPTERYTVVGAPRYSLCQTEGGANDVGVLKRVDDGYELLHIQYPANVFDIGSVINFSVTGEEERHIASGEVASWVLSADEVGPVLEDMGYPILFEGEFHWPGDFPDI
jgi:hypothetical protein